MMLLSVVTINYNNIEGLKKTIPSVLAQNYSELEYIIIDGGSLDGSKEYIESIESNCIAYWVSEPDNGLYDAMNKGIDHASGEYILFLNSGDMFFKPASLSYLADCAISKNADIVYGSALYAYTDGLVLRNPQNLCMMVSELPFCHQAVMVRTSLAQTHPFNISLRFIADYNMFYRLWKEGRHFYQVKDIICVYDANGLSSAKTHMYEIYKEQCIIHNSQPLRIVYIYRFLKSLIKEFVRKVIPIKLRNRLLHRTSTDLSKHPLDYYIARYR